jgi:hypothetical protein
MSNKSIPSLKGFRYTKVYLNMQSYQYGRDVFQSVGRDRERHPCLLNDRNTLKKRAALNVDEPSCLAKTSVMHSALALIHARSLNALFPVVEMCGNALKFAHNTRCCENFLLHSNGKTDKYVKQCFLLKDIFSGI